MAKKLNELSAAQAAQAIERGEATAEALAIACLERIDERDEKVGAWAFIDRKHVLQEARALDRTPQRSRLHGVPFGIKDIIDTADYPTMYNSPIYRGYRPKADAACVALLKRAGCLILGKAVTTEFANIQAAGTRNPRNLNHTPGGSSSGSAAAVADLMVPLSLGTQTAGSVIRPAAYCGVFAIKPSFGSINRAGVKPLAESLDTIGLFGRTPEDLMLALDILSGRTISRKAGARPRIGLCRTQNWELADGATRVNLEEAARRLERAGATVSDFEMPPGAEQLATRHGVIMGFESARALAWEYANFPEQISAALRGRLEEGWMVTRADYDTMRESARICRRALADKMRDFDFLLTPSAPGAAPASIATTGDSIFNRAWTLLGVPCVNVPYGEAPNGLPLGVQLVGPSDADMMLLAWAQWVADSLHVHG